MREILFRGKRIFDNGQWVEGCLLNVTLDGKTWHLIFGDDFQRTGLGITAMQHAAVNPATVGQYTGLKDKNGKRIFEGDICKNDKTGGIVFVAWHGTMAGFVWSKKKWCDNLFDFGELFRVHDKYKVIGNIHDNPELMEVL